MNPAAGSEIYIGLMSGTSLDGIDLAVVDFASSPPGLLHCSTTAFDGSLRQRLRELSNAATTELDTLYELDAELGECYAAAVNRALELATLDRANVAALGCHGQTIRHRPDAAFPYSAQIGDPNRLATLTGITTVADFRRKDIALGGQGAPLAPAFHRFLFRSNDEPRIVANIGGIANLTYLPAAADQPVLGFDTGPGNTLLDQWVQTHRASVYDEDGEWARSGCVIDELLQRMLVSETYFSVAPPKSTGTEHFNLQWLDPYLKAEYDNADVQATLLELTVQTLAAASQQLPAAVTGWYLCGGGTHNRFLLERLAAALPESSLQTTDELGLDPDYVEAVAFAWLARERIRLHQGSLSEVTRARHPAVLGAIYSAD